MKQKYKSSLIISSLIFLLWGMGVHIVHASVPKISKEELKTLLGNPDVIIIDVRLERDWRSSSLKIKGAVWEDFLDVDTWAKKYPKDKIIVLYCD
jgi:rhodanese-related sulfurtransferase